ncbi:MAG: hypothetical protein MI892_08790 [Desulfobacterales bacterium]|nr:hypothetical protein [Desulfobacterales bacterium]
MNRDFINRFEEINKFLVDFRKKGEKNRVRIIRAASGVGKSRLCEEFLNKIDIEVKAKVDISQNEALVRSDWFYLQQIVRSIDLVAPSKLKLKFFLRNWGGETTRALFINQIVSIAAEKSGFKSAKVLYDRFFGQGEFQIEEIVGTSSSAQQRIMIDYVRWIAQQTRLCINIENIQQIDSSTLNFLTFALLKNDCGLYLLLEYTEDDPDGISLDHIVEKFERQRCYCDLRVYRLEPLKISHAMEMLKNIDGGFEAFIKNAYYEIGGNLRRLIDLDVTFALNPDSSSSRITFDGLKMVTEATLENISTLPSDLDRFILNIIYAHGSEAPRDLIGLVRTYHPSELKVRSQKLVNESIKQLIKQELIEEVEDGTILKIAQDSIGNELKNNTRHHHFLILAYDFLRRIYESPEGTNSDFFISKDNQLVILLKCYIELGQESRAINLMKDIARVALGKNQMHSIVRYLEKIVSTVGETGSQKTIKAINRQVIKLYYFLGNMESALELLKTTPKFGISYNLNYASLLDLNNHHKKCLNYCNCILRGAPSLKPEERLRFNLIKLAALRNMNHHAEVDELFHRLVKTKEFQNLMEYGYLLRNAELVQMDASSVVDYLRKSINHFKAFNKDLDEARSYIAITLHLTQIHAIDEAKRLLEKADRLLAKIPIEKHSLYNNLAAVNIYRGELGESTEAWFDEAEASATANWDRMIVVMNRMVFCALCGKQKEALEDADEIKELLEQKSPHDKEIRKIAFWNLSLLYRLFNRTIEAAKYLELAKLIKNDFHEQEWTAKFSNESYTDGIYQWSVPLPFIPTFLSYWTIDLV